MKSTDFLGKLSTILCSLAKHTLSFSPSLSLYLIRSSQNWTLHTGSFIGWFRFSAFTEIFIFIFPPVLILLLVVVISLVANGVSLCDFPFFCCMWAKNICKYHAIQAYVSSGTHCISYPYPYTHIHSISSYTNSYPHSHLHPIHHSTFKRNAQHLILFAFGLIFFLFPRTPSHSVDCKFSLAWFQWADNKDLWLNDEKANECERNSIVTEYEMAVFSIAQNGF